jgi:hypothetical protein
MRLSRITFLVIALLVPQLVAAQRNAAAQRAWKPFLSAFNVAIKKRDREALKRMMVRDFYFSGGGGDDNHDDDSRDEAFAFWDEPYTRGWKAFDKVLAHGSVPMAAWWDHGAKREHPSRIAPPAANIRKVIDRAGIDWLAIFEFRDGRWYCTSFSQCCD